MVERVRARRPAFQRDVGTIQAFRMIIYHIITGNAGSACIWFAKGSGVARPGGDPSTRRRVRGRDVLGSGVGIVMAYRIA